MNTGLLRMISKILVWLVSIGGVIILLLRGRLKDAKIKEQGRDLQVEKAVAFAREKATEALIRGLENESKPAKRGYFGSKPE